MDLKRIPYGKIFFTFFEICIGANLVLLNVIAFVYFRSNPQQNTAATTNTQQTTQTTPIINPLITSPTPTATIPTPRPTIAPIAQTTTPVVSVKEYVVPFGNGYTNTTDWSDVPGLQSSIDSTNYPAIKTATFEVSATTPTGNQTAWIRLFNKTAGHPVWFSDVSISGGDTQYLTSQPVSLDTGNNVYQVQMKTQLGYQTTINQAKLHIILQ